MKKILGSIPLFCSIIVILLFSIVNSQTATDTCSANLDTTLQLNFPTSSFLCQSVWNSQGFILRFAQTEPTVWSFVLSAPSRNGYVGIGFSANGRMVGSSAIVGWVASDGTASMRRYFLGGQSQNLVVVDQGNLQINTSSASILLQSSRIYMAFQLNTTQPENRILYSVGPAGRLPRSPDFGLAEHDEKVSTAINYASGETQTRSTYSRLRRNHGILNILGWGILIPIGAIIARYFRHLDPAWFYSHTIIQTIGFILGFSGIICGFVLNNHLNPENINSHRALGIFILLLGCLQVIAFIARPKKDTKSRLYWNWYHFTVGRVLIFLAAINIFYGIHLGEAGRGWNAGFGVALAILFIVSVLLEIRMWMKRR